MSWEILPKAHWGAATLRALATICRSIRRVALPRACPWSARQWMSHVERIRNQTGAERVHLVSHSHLAEQVARHPIISIAAYTPPRA